MGRQNRSVNGQQYSGVSMHIPLKKYADVGLYGAWFAGSYYDTDWAKAVWGEPNPDETE